MAASWPSGGGEMGERIRALDWGATSLGSIESWPLRLRALVELMLASLQPAYIGWGPELASLYNDGCISIVGAKHPAALGQPYAEVWAEVWDEVRPMIDALMAGQAQYVVDRPVPLAGRDVPMSWFTFSWTPVRDESGRVMGFFSVATETTQKVLAEEALRASQQVALSRSEHRYRMLFDSIDEGFCVLDVLFDERERPVDCRYVEVNRAFERQSGLNAALGKTFRQLAPGIEPSWIEVYGRVALTGEPIRFVDYAASVGRWFDVYAFRAGEPHDHKVAVLFTDVTQRRKAEERWRSAFQIRTVGILFWGLGFELIDLNEAFLRMSGFTREEALGLTWRDLTPDEFHPLSFKALEEVATVGESVPYEKQYFRKDGSRWWGLFAARKVGEEVVEFVLDVTERRQAEAALRDADRRKDEFLATLAHELRNPLAPLRNGLQIARLTSRPDETLWRTIDMMDRQLTHLVRLVDDLLDVGRIASAKLELRQQPVDLARVLAASVESARVAIESHRHWFTVEAIDDELLVLGDYDRLCQVFMNLLSNAAKYTEPGGRIGVSLRHEGHEAVLEVADSGIGIPSAELPRVFDLFSQVRSHQGHTEGGLGIGLALVKRIVSLHGGRAEAYSAGPGLGSTFSVHLPLLRRPGPPESRAAASSQPVSDAKPRRVLVADDNADAAASLAEVLQLFGHQVWTALDGEEAIGKVQRLNPDIVFLDLGMPRLDGIEAARRIRSLPSGRDVVLVALTGWGQDSDRQRTTAAGFDRHLTKPVDLEMLRAVLAEAGVR